MQGKKMLPPIYLLIAIVGLVALHFLLPAMRLIPRPSNILGILPFAFGIVINVATGNAPKRAETTVRPFEEWAAPFTGGVYSISGAGMPPDACCREGREQGR